MLDFQGFPRFFLHTLKQFLHTLNQFLHTLKQG